MEGANMNDIIRMAQQVASQIAVNQPTDGSKNVDMSQMISQVTDSVSKMVTPEFIEQMASGNGSSLNDKEVVNSKIKLNTDQKESKSKKNKNKIEELQESDEDCGLIAPRTKDLHFTLNVTLEELYIGKVKKLAVRRKRIVSDGKKKSIVEEKKKISVTIEPGMFDEQVITFNKQADEKDGYETGDIVITLCCSEHDEFERENNNLIIEKEISLYESYSCGMTIVHLDGKEVNIKSSPINIFGEEIDCYRKLKGYGMPIYGTEDEVGDLIIKFKPILPGNFTNEQFKTLKELFPPVNKMKNLQNESEHELEIVTESDFEYSDSEDEYSDSEEETGEEDSEGESEEEFEDESEEEIQQIKNKHKNKSKSTREKDVDID